MLRQLTHRVGVLEAVRAAAERCLDDDSDAVFDELALRLERARATAEVPELAGAG